MVELTRVDERLLHGQVAVTWVSEVQPDSILVANDEIMENEMAKMALKMVKPNGVNLAIRSIEGGAQVLNDPRAKDLKIFVIVKTIKDALRLCELTDCIHKVNIGGVKKKEGGKLVAAAVYLNDDDLDTLQQLCNKVANVEFRMIPSDSAKKAKDVLGK